MSLLYCVRLMVWPLSEGSNRMVLLASLVFASAVLMASRSVGQLLPGQDAEAGSSGSPRPVTV